MVGTARSERAEEVQMNETTKKHMKYIKTRQGGIHAKDANQNEGGAVLEQRADLENILGRSSTNFNMNRNPKTCTPLLCNYTQLFIIPSEAIALGRIITQSPNPNTIRQEQRSIWYNSGGGGNCRATGTVHLLMLERAI